MLIPKSSCPVGAKKGYIFSEACSIEISANIVLITGGAVVNVAPGSIEWDYNKRVTVYGTRTDGTTGWISEMPEMNVARATHGCTSYFENGKRVDKFICTY